MNISETERAKYERVWQMDAYHERSPGAENVGRFMQLSHAVRGQSVIDIGAGSGAGSAELAKHGLIVNAFDLTDAGWAAHPGITLKTGTIWRDLPYLPPRDFAYCCDVMEHLPEAFVGLSVERIRMTATHSFFSVHFGHDLHGAAIGQTLHMTVKPFVWWRDVFRELGHLKDARDLMGHGVFYVA